MEEAVKLRRYLASLVVYSKVLSVSDGRDNWQPTTSVQVFVEQVNNPVLYDIENYLLAYCSNIQQDLPRDLEKTVQKLSLKIV